MRTSLIIATFIATPVLLVTACGTPHASSPIKGTVKEMKYEPAKTKTKHTPITQQVCTTKRVKGKSRRTCKSVATGRYRTTRVTVRHECYELDIRLPDGSVTEVCDKGAYRVLEPGDRYNSGINYNLKKVH